MKSVILILTVCRRPLASSCILNQNVPKYVPNCLYLINFMFINNNLQDYYGVFTRTRIVDLLVTNQSPRLGEWRLGMVESKCVCLG